MNGRPVRLAPLNPGASPTTRRLGRISPKGGTGRAWNAGFAIRDVSSATASRNDLLHLTSGSSPFVGSFSSANSISVFFNDASLSASLLAINPATYLGGFYVDSLNFDIASLLSAASKSYYIVDSNGTFGYNGVNYSLLSSDVAYRVQFGNTNQTNSAFDTGTTSGTVLSVTMVPEPSSASLLTFALSGLLALRRRKT